MAELNHSSFALVLLGTVLIFSDWLIGRQSQQRLKRACRWWFYHVRRSTFHGLLAEDAAILREAAHRWLGRRWYSPGVPVIVLVVSVLCTWVFASRIWNVDQEIGAHIFLIVPINVFFAWLSYLITLRMLYWMAKSTKLSILLFVVIADALVAAVLYYLTVHIVIRGGQIWFFSMINDLPVEDYKHEHWFQWRLWMEIQRWLMSPLMPFLDPDVIFIGRQIFRPYQVQMLPLLMVSLSVLPTLIHTLVGLAFVFSKAFRPIIRPVASLVLLRLAQSNAGILTVIGGGLLAVAGVLAAWPKAPPPTNAS